MIRADGQGHMEYARGMEAIGSGIMDAVLAAAGAQDFSAFSEDDARRALGGRELSADGFAALLSPAAAPLLEQMAARARAETRARFGNSVSLFTPLYISNYCENGCVYCGFSRDRRIARARLDPAGIEREMLSISASGLEEILILTGESRRMSDLGYIEGACAAARRHFRVVGVEVYPMDSADYARLQACGADFVTVFQETYDTGSYGRLHPAGRKRSFPYRFNAQERALLGGMRGVGFGALLGLADFRRDAFATGLHARLIQRKYPHAEISFSCPRLRPIGGGAAFVPFELGEAELLQVICAYRLFMPFANITISSREGARFRDNAAGIAATKISAGVDVGIGRRGAAPEPAGDGQFEIADGRSVGEICAMLSARGLQPVMSEHLYV
ncbi:MAG: 2-iminoacetate synthase ThiH [Clostridiales Family XIII bacterium]|jgi:2-iminoacetate synthase|nr:2-iminoacetate synthase ThiH [Clostridiales Family XIII bacterium]